MRRGTALFSILIATLLSSFASADGVQGTISRTLFQLSLIGADGVEYRLTSRSTDALKTLNRLESGDTIVASGRLDDANGTAEIESIDFVGLKKMIGTWNQMNAKGVMQFKSYSDVNVYSYALQSTGGGVVRNHKNFKYTVSPSTKGDWVLFLSDETTTQMGFLNLKETDATISLLNSQTGDVADVIRLRKIGH